MGHRFWFVAVLCLIAFCCHGQPNASPVVENSSTDRLHERIMELESLVSRLNDRVESQQGQTRDDVLIPTEKRVHHLLASPWSFLPGKGVQLRAENSGSGEFYVSLTKNIKLAAMQTLKFDTIVTNNGNVYDISTGEFTCPTSGTYVFHLTLACEQGAYIDASIIQAQSGTSSGHAVLNTICDRSHTSGYVQNGGTAVLNLNKGDRVFVRMTWPNNTEEPVTGKGFTTFSGYRLSNA